MLAAFPRRLGWLGLALPLALGACRTDDVTSVSPDAPTTPAFAIGTTLTVTNTDDAGPGSLRQAVADAANGDVIRFDPGLAGQTIALTNVLKIGKAITLEGPTEGVRISGSLSTQVFETFEDIVMRNLSIVNGRHDTGAGIHVVDGQLTLDHVLVADNESPVWGGGIFLSDDFGSPELVLVNSTISGNAAQVFGGGIFVSGASVFMRNTTIAANVSGEGGGISINRGNLSLRNSIIAANTDLSGNANNCLIDPSVDLTFTGGNLSNDGTCGNTAAYTVGDARLGPLSSNGGPTKTHALSADSPAIDAGALCTEATDQRYVARPQGASCDLGAFEFNNFGTFRLTIGPNVAVKAGTGAATVTGTISCSKPGSATLSIALSQTQKATGRFATIVQGSFETTTVVCGTSPSSWTAAIAPISGKFVKGTATGRVSTATWPQGFLAGEASASLKLFQVK
jgi:hypothetical protein